MKKMSQLQVGLALTFPLWVPGMIIVLYALGVLLGFWKP